MDLPPSNHCFLQIIQHKTMHIKINPSNMTSIWFNERSGAFKALHAFNRVRVPWIVAQFQHQKPAATNAENQLNGRRILDIGCGAGILSLALARLGADVVGIDADANAIGLAQKASGTLAPATRSNVRFVQATSEQFAADLENRQGFDAIVASEVVEHVTDLPSFIQSCCKLAKSSSPMFFTTINRTICSRLMAKILAEDVLRILPKGLHDYEKFVKPEELQRLLIDNQCRVGPVLGLLYNPVQNEWSWNGSFSGVSYAMMALTGKSLSSH